jgi:creatinine amidohydrolase
VPLPSRDLTALSQPEAEALLARSGLVLIPCGSVEQHGPHLPFATDWYAAHAVAQRMAEQLDALVAPIGPLGVTPFHAGIAGTLTLRPTTFGALIEDVCDSLVRHGARRFGLVNWHEGNQAALNQAAVAVQSRHDNAVRFVVVQAMWIAHELVGHEVGLTHGGAIEALAVQADHPDLVHLERATNPGEPVRAAAFDALRRRRTTYPLLADIREITPTGWYGSLDGVTPDRGRDMVDGVALRAAEQVRECFQALLPLPAGEGRREGSNGAARR